MDFIEPHVNIDSTAHADWEQFANLTREQVRARWKTPAGRKLLDALFERGWDREVLADHVGTFTGHYDLRGAPLSGRNLANADLSSIDFFCADFSRANLAGCNLSDSYLSECNLSDTCLNWAVLEGALLDNVTFTGKTSFLGVKLHTVNFMLATLLYDLALSQQRIQQLEKHYPIFAAFLRISSDYGRSFNRYMAWVIGFVLSYGLAYWQLMGKPLLDCMYFSLVTFATVGYGDILPATVIEKLLVMSEIGIGYLMGGLLVAILAKRVLG
ncbi:MAG: pentapeptide repeat-containing protein [Methylomicrobium sp.]